MARAKRWKPMVRTEGDVQKAVAKIGDLPKEVIALYVARETKGDECIKACEAILKRDPEHCAALIYMGTILAERRRYIKALRFLDRAVEISALMYPAWQWKGMCETYLKRPRAARFSFARMMEIMPDVAFPYCGIAVSYYLIDAKDLAIKFLDDVVATGRVKDADTLVHVRAMFEERMGLKDEAFIHYLEGQMMAKEKDADTAFKIHSLASKDVEAE